MNEKAGLIGVGRRIFHLSLDRRQISGPLWPGRSPVGEE
jgi:hypothetical protein